MSPVALRALIRVWWQEGRGRGGLWLLLATLTLAVTATTVLSQTIGQIQVAARQQAGQLLGGDLLVSSSRPLPAAPAQWASALGLRQSGLMVFASMLQAGDPARPEAMRFQLVNVKAVQSGYPLRGSLQATSVTGQPLRSPALPAAGQIWLEPALLDTLGIRLGDWVTLGEARLQVTARIDRDANRELGLGGFSPTAIVALVDVPRFQVIAAGSRIEYRLLLAGPAEAVARYASQFRQQQGPAQSQDSAAAAMRLRDAEQGNRRLLSPLRKFDQFTQLANVITLLLCGLAIAYTTSRLSGQMAPVLALLRSLGVRRGPVWLALLFSLGALWLLATGLGAGLGALLSWGLLQLLRGLLPALELDFSGWVLLRQGLPDGAWTALLTLLAFGLPPLWQLLRTPPGQILRRQDPWDLPASGPGWRQRVHGLWPWLPTVAALGLLLWILGVPLRLAVLSVGLGLPTLALLWALLAGGLALLRRWKQAHGEGLATGSLLRTPARSALQLWSLALGLALMASLWLIRSDLLDRWQAELPPGTANYFAYGLPPDQREAFLQALQRNHWPASPLYPVVKARMGQHNGQPFAARLQSDFLLQRELNLSMAAQLPANNQIVAGRGFERPNELSVEQGVAERLGLKVGDRLSVLLPTGEVSATVVNLRTVQWDTFSPNFFFIYSPGSLEAEAGSYLGSFFVPPGQKSALAPLVQAFSTTVLIDIQAILDEVRRMVQLISQALGLLGGLAALAGLLVLVATLDASLDRKRREAAILRTLGLSQQALRRRVLAELGALGACAGLLAAVLAEAVLWGLSWRLALSARLHPALLVLPLLLGLLAMLVGWLRLRTVWRTPAWQVLRR